MCTVSAIAEKQVNTCGGYMSAKAAIITFIIKNLTDDKPAVAWEKA